MIDRLLTPEHIEIAAASFVSGGGAWRLLRYISENLIPLPANAGWFAKQVYQLVKGASGHDPNANGNAKTN